MKLDDRGNWTLIGLLVAAAIIVILAGVYYAGGRVATVKENSPLLDKSSTKKTVAGKAIDTAKAEDCRQRLTQIRTGIETYKTSNGTEANPSTLEDIGLGVSTDYFYCPVSGKAYIYDSAAGTVQCPTHASF